MSDSVPARKRTCWAHSLGGCGSLSREHVLSQSIFGSGFSPPCYLKPVDVGFKVLQVLTENSYASILAANATRDGKGIYANKSFKTLTADEDLDRRPEGRVRDLATRPLPATTGIHRENDTEVHQQTVDLARQHAHDRGVSWPAVRAERRDRRQSLCGWSLVGYTGDRHGSNSRLSA